jgi:8-oxo-dGTP pyrophosphatase MutT (NUDIX family)
MPHETAMAQDAPALRQRIVERLRGTVPSTSIADWRLAGMPPEQSRRFQAHFPPNPIPAAVLVPIVDHAADLTVLLTQRAAGLKNHAGQVSFPGGRMEPQDADSVSAALRETREEIGLDPRHVEIIGFLPDHLIVSGYRVTPVVALVSPTFTLELDRMEVVDTFEVPLRHVFDPRNHVTRKRRFGEDEVELFDIPYGERNIWGATAGMLLTFCDLVRGMPPR